jgi:hypothetical protein
MDWLNGRRSRDPSFESGLLSNNHRDMSMSIEFNGRMRSHLSMEMQLPVPRSGVAVLQNGALVDGQILDGRTPTGSELQPSISALFAPMEGGGWGADPAMGTGAASTTGSVLPSHATAGGHISRSKLGMSKDDLMLDLHQPHHQLGLSADQLAYGDRSYRLPSGSSQHDFKDIRPYL